jgi:hypothetical protein
VKKIALENIDISCAKKVSLHLLGDKTGTGKEFINSPGYNRELINFLIEETFDSKDDYVKYRRILSDHFPRRFHILNV